MLAKDELIEFVEDGNARNTVICEQSLVRLTDPQWMRCVDAKNEEIAANEEIDAFLEDETDGSSESNNCLIYSCVRNEHKTHLMAYDEDMSSQPMMATKNDKIVFSELNKMYPQWIKVEDLNRKCEGCDL